ncbi:hypothetical protein PENSUB_2406 [Penicillium subrubescens]|uniref:Peptidase A1 domain-containing protein n=1 Tax=Penicillium subrubescens TaxID=1316194 RepID=A0A1Q5UHT0_9EURO|nr:hypothetical protein PENSUB_2406 [Penicillium subrubescens]
MTLQNVWFGSFDVGNSKNLTLLIDTGSSDVIVSPGLYKGGPHSVDTSSTFANTYGTTESTLYNDTVKFGFVTAYQTIGSVQPDANVEALIPADGIVGFAGLEVSSFHGAPPFFHSLCEQGEMSPCRFSITLGNTEKGTLLLGALDQALFMGDLSTTSIIQEWALYADIALNGKISRRMR